jgi:Siphovirus Gp157
VNELSTPREDLHGAVAEEREAPELAIAEVDAQALELVTLRGECQTEKETAAIDVLLKGYVETDLEKITPVAALLKHCESKATEGRADEERKQKERGRWAKAIVVLKAIVQSVMQERKLSQLSNAQVRFRLQDNPVQVEITDEKKIENKFRRAVITMPWDEWMRLRSFSEIYLASAEARKAKLEPIVIEQVIPSIDSNALKGALLVKVKCEDCDDGKTRLSPHAPAYPCTTCKGSQLSPATVPGARLTQTQHLRVE